MIVVDTSVWVDHFRKANAHLVDLLKDRQVLSHPFVIGELALGGLRQSAAVLSAMAGMPRADVARDGEVLQFIDRYALAGRRVGYLDIHLLAAVRLTPGSQLWTRDLKLRAMAAEFGVAHDHP